MNRDKIWDKLQPLRQALDKVRSAAPPGAGRFELPGRKFTDEPRWEVVLQDGDRDEGTFVEIVTYASAAEIADWQRRPDAEIRGTGMTWRQAVPAKKRRRAA
ncbi:MAG: hypothetical protein WAJ85_10025 [Candidatus Baltobacteraceae bacterium]